MKARTLFVMPAAIALLASCSTEQLETPQTSGTSAYVEVKATQAIRPETRMSYTESGTPISMNALWEEDEKLGVVNYNDNSSEVHDLNVLAGNNDHAGTSTMQFTGTLPYPSTGAMEGKYNFYYPAAGTGTNVVDLNTVVYNYTTQTAVLTGGVAATDDLWKYDVMYTGAAVDPADGITLERANALLRFELDLPADAPAITNIYLSATDPVFYERLQLIFGDATAGSASVSVQGLDPVNTISLAVDNDATSASPRTITAYMMTPAVYGFTGLLVKVSAVAADGTTYSYIYNLIEDDNETSNDALVEGYAYTFAPAATLVHDQWAGSNIYWDETAYTLTFDPPYEMKHTMAQGVFFKWGSLVGISPAMTNGSINWSGDVIIYVPTYSVAGDGLVSVTWFADKAVNYTQADYSQVINIPYEDDTSLPFGSNINSLDYASREGSIVSDAKWMAKKGDICRFVALHSSHSGTPYYMPTLDQFGATSDYEIANPNENVDTSIGNAQGTASLIESTSYTYKKSAAFPSPGLRATNGGLSATVGRDRYYWSSSSANNAGAAFSFHIKGGNISDDPLYAQPIRCIRN